MEVRVRTIGTVCPGRSPERVISRVRVLSLWLSLSDSHRCCLRSPWWPSGWLARLDGLPASRRFARERKESERFIAPEASAVESPTSGGTGWAAAACEA